MRRILSLSLFFFLSFAVSAQEIANPHLPDPTKNDAPNVIETPRYRLEMPAPIKTTVREDVSTPWGKADITSYKADTGSRMVYLFRDYSFPASRTITTAKLKQVRSHFLQARKCSAETVPAAAWTGEKNWKPKHLPALRVTPPPKWKNAEGKPWPQTLISGTCVSGERFMILEAIANKRLYRLHVSAGMPSVNFQLLIDAMTWLTDHVHVTEK